ncbi:MAG: B12-binding domain-containing radical SAM protein, partial [Ardenticatenaceae bacterium]
SEGAHFVLLGEGEETLDELMDRLTGRSDTPFEEILGLAYLPMGSGKWRVGSGEWDDNSQFIIHNPRRRDIKNLDALPFPAWDLVDVGRYREIWQETHGYYSMNMVTTRGCPYHCNWCAKPIWGQRYNVRSPANVVAELTWLREQFQPDHIWFADDIVGLKPGWWTQFAALVETAGVQTPFKCLSRVDLLLRKGDIDALKRAGCQIVWVGAESGSQKVLDVMEKGTTVEQIHEARRRLREAGVRVGFFLQFGYPGETREDIERTLQLVRDCQPDDIGMSVSYPLPGTKFHERVKDQLGVKQNWLDSNDLAMLYEGPFTTEFYRQLHTVLHKEFRAQRYWNELKGLLRQPGGFCKRHLRSTASMLYHRATLPVARRKLNQLEVRSQRGLNLLTPGMDHEAAATPTPQQ